MLVFSFEVQISFIGIVRRNIYVLIFVCLVGFPFLATHAQSFVKSEKANSTQTEIQDEYATIPRGFAGIVLGDTRALVLKKLNNHAYFFSPDEPDVTFLPASKDHIVEVVGKRFVKKALFQFNATLELMVITLYLDTNVVDYFSVYTRHEKKYGRAEKISPTLAQWRGDTVMVLLEKPLQVKYVYVENAQKTIEDPSIGEQEAITRTEERNEFLSLF